jgi:hypothetical protein
MVVEKGSYLNEGKCTLRISREGARGRNKALGKTKNSNQRKIVKGNKTYDV